MAVSKRKNGEGSWGKKKINGISYVTFQKTYPGLTSKRKEFYGRTTKEVKEKIEKFEAENHLLPSKEIKEQVFGDYIYIWLYNVKLGTISENTFDRAENTFNNYIREYPIATYPIKQLSSEIIQSHLKELSKKYSKSTIDKVYFMLNQVLSYAVKQRDVSYNLMNDVDMIKEIEVASKKKTATFLTMEQVNILFEECNRINKKGFMVRGKEGERVYGNNAYAIILIIYTGIRIGELRALRWEDIDFNDKMMYVDESATFVKNRNENNEKKTVELVKAPKTENSIRPIPLADRAIWALTEMEKQNPKHSKKDFVFFNSTKDGISASNINRTLNNMTTRASLPHCSVHGLRHTFGSLLINEDEKNITIVSSLLGHTDISTTYKIYTHIIKKKKVETISILNKQK